MMRFITLLLTMALGATLAPAQTALPLLTADEAVRTALEQNYNMRLSRSDVEAARINNTKGNAGMLPTVNLTASETFTLSAFQQQLANGNEFNALGANFNNINAGVQLSHTLIDGGRRNIVKKRLEAQQTLSEIQLTSISQQTTAAVLQAYYDIVRSKEQERAVAELITLNEERLRIAEARLTAGYAAQTDALQARIDLNQRRSDLLAQQNITATGKRRLNTLLARPASVEFEVEQLPAVTYVPDRAQLLQQLAAQNPALLALQKSADIAAALVDENRTLNKPRLTGVGQFNALRTDNGAGFLRNNTQAGVAVGATFAMPLYSGGNIRRQVETARVAAQQAATRLDAQRAEFESALDNQLAFYQTQQAVLNLEEENTKAARENLLVSTERFRLGQTNGLEVQVAQNTLEQALFRRNVALFNLKNTEIALRLVAGSF